MHHLPRGLAGRGRTAVDVGAVGADEHLHDVLRVLSVLHPGHGVHHALGSVHRTGPRGARA